MTGPTSPGKSTRAYEVMRRRILAHDYPPGHRLVLHRIATELGMSVVPVREAMRKLEAEHLVDFQRNVGAQVVMIDDTAYRDSMQTLALLEGAATALAARSLTAVDVQRARQLNERLVDTLDRFDPRTFTTLNEEFHGTLFTGCPNPRLLTLVREEWARLGHVRVSTFSFVPGRARQSVREHEEILRLIERQAPLDEIERAARDHRTATLAAYEAHEARDRTAETPGLSA